MISPPGKCTLPGRQSDLAARHSVPAVGPGVTFKYFLKTHVQVVIAGVVRELRLFFQDIRSRPR